MEGQFFSFAGIVEDIRKFRGHIEGGVAIREVEDFQPGTEERYFVFKGTPYARGGQQVPSVVANAAQTIDSPFFSVDTVVRKDGQMRIVELGDGQVSDRKAWSVGEFLGIFQSIA